MRSDNTIVNKALHRLLRSLLIIHSAPKRDRIFKEKKSNCRNKRGGKQVRRVTNCSISEAFISMKNQTRNGIRRLFNTEEKRKLKFQAKGRIEKAGRCQLRIDTYRNVLRREKADDLADNFVREEVNDEVIGDTTLRRIKRLLQIAKPALFSDQVITEARLREMDSDFTQREVDVLMKILNFVQPYIPSKANYSSSQYQLPFVIMANQVLKAIGYEGQVGTLEIDRIGVSVLKQNTSTNRRLAGSGRQQSVTKDEYKIENIQDLTQETLNRTIDNCVLIDPGRCDLMYCMHETSTVKEKKAFIFTKNNRTNLSKHFRSLRKRSQPFAIKAAGAALSETNSSSVSVDKFVQYIKTRASNDLELSLIRKKKTILLGHQVLYTEEELSRHSLFHCNTPEELEESYTYYANARDTQHELYYSRSNCNPIGLAGLFGSTFLCFDETSTRTSKARFFDSALDFLQKKQRMGSPTDGGNTL
ncbi:hypothetical protein HPULCUR_008621 [Helicostylum pulchrum]|uniref:Uncharacterized protein n=1 Tax=Helicostylum pulchrum TaxID=562976 RepID=A0ABP9Y849_9FUNG